MEQVLISVLIATAFLIIFLVLFWFRNQTKRLLPLPPGTTGWPILGENIEYFALGRKGIPDKFIQDRMKKYSSQVFKTSLIGQTMAVLCGPEGNKFIFSNEGRFFRFWWPESSSKIFPSPLEELTKIRVLTRGFFNPEMLNRCTEVMDSLTKRHLPEDLYRKDIVMGAALAKKYNFMYTCKMFLTIENPIQVAKLFDLFSLIMAGFISPHINFPGTPFNRAIKASKLLQNELATIIKQRKIDLYEKRMPQGEDILSHFLMATDENEHFMNEESIIAAKIIALLLASYDSISNIITFTMKYLAELPAIYNEVLWEQRKILKTKAPGELLNMEDLQKMTYTWNVVNEVMRLQPTFQGTFAEAICDISYAGFSIPKGWKVHWNAYSTHTNPKYFPEPERFDPSRFEGKGPAPYTFVPFGGGPRICPGMQFARSAILVFLHNLVIKYSWKKVIPDEKIFFDPLPRLTNGLPIHLQPHDPLRDTYLAQIQCKDNIFNPAKSTDLSHVGRGHHTKHVDGSHRPVRGQ